MPLRFDVRNPTPESVSEAARSYGENGYLRLTGLEDAVLPHFDRALADAFQLEPQDLGAVLETSHDPERLAPDVLERLARVQTPEDVALSLLGTFEPLLLRILGAFVHVSSDYHIQLKSGPAAAVDHGGFLANHLEVQGVHLLHQDFMGASIPTSPSGVTLWVALNDCDEWNLRMFPGQHVHGLLSNEFIAFDDPCLAPLGAPIDTRARRGDGMLFNALMLHGSANPGPTRRVSCDLRFFPLTGYLPSKVHTLGTDPMKAHLEGLSLASNDTLQAPFLEALAFLGQANPEIRPEGRSVLWWVQYLRSILAGDRAGARESFERFVNLEFGADSLPAFDRFFDGELHQPPIRGAWYSPSGSTSST